MGSVGAVHVAFQGALDCCGVGLVALWMRFLGGGGALVCAPGGRLTSVVGRMLGVVAIQGGAVAHFWRAAGRRGRVADAGGGGTVLVVAGLVVLVVVVVLRLVPVMVLPVCPQEPPALQWDRGLGHHLQPLVQPGLVEGCGGLGVGLDRDCR